MNPKSQMFIFVFLPIILGIFSIGCDKKKEPNKKAPNANIPANVVPVSTDKKSDSNHSIIEHSRNEDAQRPSLQIKGGREIHMQRQGYCNCCKSNQPDVKYWKTTFVESFGSFRAGDTIYYGICDKCRDYCNFPYNDDDKCTIRSSLGK